MHKTSLQLGQNYNLKRYLCKMASLECNLSLVCQKCTSRYIIELFIILHAFLTSNVLKSKNGLFWIEY